MSNPTIEVVDTRTLCQLKDCDQRAHHLVAWPHNQPVVLCTKCWEAIQRLPVKQPSEWKRWLVNNSKTRSSYVR